MAKKLDIVKEQREDAKLESRPTVEGEEIDDTIPLSRMRR